MAKDPAFLFYPNDWLGGNSGMNFEEKGAFLELLILQFNKGSFTIEQARKVLNQSFDKLWPELKEKFEIENNNKFFNERLRYEKNRRSDFTKSRGQNRKGKATDKQTVNENEITYDTSYEIHMTPHMENGNGNENIIRTETEIKNVPENATENENVTENKNLSDENLKQQETIQPELIQETTIPGIKETISEANPPEPAEDKHIVPLYKSAPPPDIEPTDVEIWTQLVLDKADPEFEQLILGELSRGQPVRADEDFIKGHETKCLRERTRFKNQNHFRKSLLSYLKTATKRQNGNTTKTYAGQAKLQPPGASPLVANAGFGTL